MLDGIEEPEPPLLPPDGEGMLGELRPPPPDELLRPPEDPDDPEEPLEDGDEVGDGIEVDDDCCWQPPISSAETALTSAACTATASSRFLGR